MPEISTRFGKLEAVPASRIERKTDPVGDRSVVVVPAKSGGGERYFVLDLDADPTFVTLSGGGLGRVVFDGASEKPVAVVVMDEDVPPELEPEPEEADPEHVKMADPIPGTVHATAGSAGDTNTDPFIPGGARGLEGTWGQEGGHD